MGERDSGYKVKKEIALPGRALFPAWLEEKTIKLLGLVGVELLSQAVTGTPLGVSKIIEVMYVEVF